MTYNPKFGPAPQTPTQRAFVLPQMQEALFSTTPACRAVDERYTSGELSWVGMRQSLNLVSC